MKLPNPSDFFMITCATLIGVSLGVGSRHVVDPFFTPDPNEWFTEIDVDVPNFVVGDDPVVTYERTIVRPFTATFYVELYPVSDEGVRQPRRELCEGTGTFGYSLGTGNKSLMTLSEYVGELSHPNHGAKCPIVPGLYVLETKWEMHVEDDQRTQTNVSNIFKVSANDTTGRRPSLGGGGGTPSTPQQ